MLVDYLAYNLKLVISITFNISLQGLLRNDLV